MLAALALLTTGTASATRQPDNLAFVDPALTQSAIDQASGALAAVLSYDYRKLDENAQLATEKGTEQYVRQHTDQVNKARANLTKQKHVVATKVVGVGVRDLRAETARLVMFMDQTVTRGDTNKSATTGFAAVVDLKLVEQVWRLDSMTTSSP